jgi:hypothetical protein
MMDMGEFVNGFVKDAQTFWLLSGAGLLILVIFSALFNRWVADLGDRKIGYTALLVAVGNVVTLLIVAVISWKAAGIVLVAFIASGMVMIVGDVERSHEKREQAAKNARPRRKALPYAACGLIDEANMLLSPVERGLKAMLMGELDVRKIGLFALNVKDAISKLQEARKVEGE